MIRDDKDDNKDPFLCYVKIKIWPHPTCNSNSFSTSCRIFFSASNLLLNSSISVVVSVILIGGFPFWNQRNPFDQLSIWSFIKEKKKEEKKRKGKKKKERDRNERGSKPNGRTSFVSLISIPNSFFNCLFSSWRDSILFLAIERSSFIRAFVVVNDSTLAWRLVTVALKSMMIQRLRIIGVYIVCVCACVCMCVYI